MEYRFAKQSDCAQLVALVCDDDLFSEHNTSLCDQERALRTILDDPHSEILLIVNDEVICAMAQVTLIPQVGRSCSHLAYISSVRVHRSMRGQGCGAVLMRWIFQYAAQQGCQDVFLVTDVRRAAAQRFYQKLGFTPCHVGMVRSLEDISSPQRPVSSDVYIMQ